MSIIAEIINKLSNEDRTKLLKELGVAESPSVERLDYIVKNLDVRLLTRAAEYDYASIDLAQAIHEALGQ